MYYIVYSPGMNSQINDMIQRCTICLEHQQRNTKEPMIPSRIPSKPWEIVATNLFTWDKSEYLIIVDYHSRYFEVAKLPDTKSTTGITCTKSIFARHGIPSEVISNNGPNTPQRSSHFLLNSGNSNTLLSVHYTPRQMALWRRKFKQ